MIDSCLEISITDNGVSKNNQKICYFIIIIFVNFMSLLYKILTIFSKSLLLLENFKY